MVGFARGDSETWRKLPDAIAAQAGFKVNHLRVLVGDQKLVGAIVMGDQTLSKAIQHLVSCGADITSIRAQLLQSNPPLADILADYWSRFKGGNPIHVRR
jgi:NAD(P)H-nitrite reductase large subunit